MVLKQEVATSHHELRILVVVVVEVKAERNVKVREFWFGFFWFIDEYFLIWVEYFLIWIPINSWNSKFVNDFEFMMILEF